MDLHTSPSPAADPRLNEAATDVPSSELQQGNDVSQQLSRDSLDTNDPNQDPEKAEVARGGEQCEETSNEQPGSQEKYPGGLVEFDGPNDPDNPKNFSLRKKWAITASMGWMTFVVTFASSIFSVATDAVSQEFDVDRVVSTLGVSLFLLVR